MNLLRNIYSSSWMLHPDAAIGYLPLIAQLIKGNSVHFDQTPQIKNYIVNTVGGGESGNSVSGRVAVIPIRGAILKDTQECGPVGLEAINEHLQSVINDSRIDAIVLDLDTPGGQASFLETFTNTIKSSNKPIVAFYNNMCASAGYYIAASCQHIFASEAGDIVGSIGTMATLADYTGYFEKEGVKVHHLYAKQSTNKNSAHRKITSGNAEEVEEGKAEYIDEMLSPMAQFFIDHVKSSRSNISNEDVFTGKTYLSSEAIELGLIDGIKSLKEVITHAFELSNPKLNNQKSNNQNTHIMSAKFKSVAAILGYEAIESKDGFVSLSDADIEKINAAVELANASGEQTLEVVEAVVATAENTPAIEALESQLATVVAEASTHTNQIAEQATLIADLSAKLDSAINGTSIEKTETIAALDAGGDTVEDWPAPSVE